MKNMLKSIMMSLVVSLFACNEQTENSNPKIDATRKNITQSNFISLTKKGWKDLAKEDAGFIIAMPYATNDNFLKEKIYPCATCLLREDAANALIKARKHSLAKDYKIIIYDCYRPLPLQQKMFNIKPDTKYVADPKRGSKHNKGVAVDISLADKEGNPLDMGTDFDDFSKRAHYNSKEVSKTAQNNRKILRKIMMSNGFTPYDNEWWHFNYKKTDYPNEDFVWDCDE